ncbi:MAG: DEAD/DEAH box helicase, partial [Flavobacteriales bacterium]|nr:DEAD/DEAH box helicase [Flavobacteriales bacterium]
MWLFTDRVLKTYFIDVILPLAVPRAFTYRVPKNMEGYAAKGMRVIVPFGKSKLYTGIVVTVHENPPEGYSAKYMDSFLDSDPVVTDIQIDFWYWISDYYMCYPGEVMLAAIPAALRLSSETKYILNPTFDGDLSPFSEREALLLEALSKAEILGSDEISEILQVKNIQHSLKNLMEGAAIMVVENVKEKFKPRTETYLSLSAAVADEDGLENAFKALERAPKQLEALMMFVQLSGRYSDNETAVKKAKLQKAAGISSNIITELIKKGVFQSEDREVGRLPVYTKSKKAGFELSEIQEKALAEIDNGFESKGVVLLHGVTSSGKTEMYIKLIERELQAGKQVLYMLPEIALTTQMIMRLQNYFGANVVVYHSRFNQNERVEVWNKVLKNTPGDGRLILGARSSLLLPFSNLGLIIVDEEHENSFKQYDPAPRYHARDAAILLAIMHRAKTLLGSATPAMESLENARNGKYGYVEVSERFGGIEPPVIELASLKE